MVKIIIIASILLMSLSCHRISENSDKPNESGLINVSYSGSKVSVSDDDIKFLGEMGFTKSATFKKNLLRIDSSTIADNSKKYGLRFMTGNTLDLFLQKNDLVTGNLTDYRGKIPDDAIIEFRRNYEQFRSEDFFFVRVSRTAKSKEGSFLCKINDEDVLNKSSVHEGNSLINGQSVQNNGTPYGLLTMEMTEKLCSKYSVEPSDLIVDHHKPYMLIIAPKDEFDMEGKWVENNHVVDPAIILLVKEGFVVLASWQ